MYDTLKISGLPMIVFKEESPKGWEIVLKTNKKIKNHNREFLRTRKRDAHPDIGGIQNTKQTRQRKHSFIIL